MKTYNTNYQDIDTLKTFLHTIESSQERSILIQIFSGTDDENLLLQISSTLKSELPQAIIIGTSTAGEILEGEMQDESIVISISLFESTSLLACSFIGDDSYKLGESVAQTILRDDTKAVIIFADGIRCNGEAILQGFSQTADKKIIVSGGMAGDNNKFQRTFVIHNDKIFENGVVAVSLNNNTLIVHNSYNLAWRAIGLPMTVTKTEKNSIEEIDHKPVIEVYREYLGDDVVQNLPNSAIEFPLIFSRANLQIARSMVAATDKSISFAGEIAVGTEVRFGVASAMLFDQGSKKLYELNANIPLESIFIYSCVARKMFLGRELERELKPLADIASVSGFFTFGELYSGYKEYQMLNITTTVLALSESSELTCKPKIETTNNNQLSLSTTALIHLVEKTISNLEAESIEKQNTIAILTQYQKAIDHSYIISQVDLHGTITFVNDLFCQISGYSSEELLNHSHNIVRHPDMPKSVFEDLWKQIKAKKIWQGVIQNRHKNGSSYYVDATIFPLLDKDDNVTGYVGIRSDITHIKLEKEKAEAILNAQDSIVLLIDEKMQIKQFNQKFFEIFNYKDTNDFLSKHSCICELFIAREGYLSTIFNGQDWLDVLISNQDKSHLALFLDTNQNERIFSVQARKINLETEAFIIATFTDVTELETARVEALSAEKAKSAFLATMSHELRTPLNAVIGFSQILISKNDMPVEMMLSFIEKIHISGKHLLSLVNNILDFSKIESGKMQLSKKEFSLNTLVNETILLIETAANNKTIRITKEGFHAVNIVADEQLIKQVILNILSNAIKFSHKNSQIQLSYTTDHHDHIITICDEGVGLSAEQLLKIFNPFYQINEHQDQMIKGTGLGLAISKKIIELHHGKIEVTSDVGKGSCFSIFLPITKA